MNARLSQPPEIPEVAVAVVADNEDRVLLVRRRGAEAGIEWQFPAGKTRPGERVREAAVRETAEETGVRVRALVRLGDRVHPATGKALAYVACGDAAGDAGVVSPREISEVAWVAVDQLDTYLPGGMFGPVRDYLTGLAAVRQWRDRTDAAATAALHAYHAGWRPNRADVLAGNEILAVLGRYVDLTGELPRGVQRPKPDAEPLLLDPTEIRTTVAAAFTAALGRALSEPWRALLKAAHPLEPQPWRPGLWRETAHAILTGEVQY